jgi:hypothetical protein
MSDIDVIFFNVGPIYGEDHPRRKVHHRPKVNVVHFYRYGL